MFAKFLKINSKLFPIKVHMFLFFCGICGPSVFLPNIVKQAGLSTSSLAVIYFSMPLIIFVSKAISGIIADKFHALRFLTMFAIFSMTIVSVPLIFIPKSDNSQATFSCTNNETIITMPSSDVNDRKFILCEIMSDSNAEFLDMCYEWKNNSENSIVPFQLDCNRITTYVEFFQFETNSSRLGIIRQIRDDTTNNGITSARCSATKTVTIFVKCRDENTTNGSALVEELHSSLFLYIFVVYNAFGVIFNIAIVYTNTVTYQLLGDESHKYGAQRMLGSIGWGVGGVICGVLIDYFSNNANKNYFPIFLLSIAILTVDTIWCIFKLEVKQSKSNEFDLKKVAKLFYRFDVVEFACWCLWCGIVQQIIWMYLPLYLEELCDAEMYTYFKSLQGIYVLMNSLSGDTLSFYFYGRLSKKINIKNCLALVLLLNTIRYFAYAIMKTPIMGILVASLDGFIFGITYNTITSYSHKIAVPGTETTVQAVFDCLFEGIGTAIGGLCGGMLYTWLGGSSLFRVFGYLCSGVFIVHLFLRFISRFIIIKSKLENTSNS